MDWNGIAIVVFLSSFCLKLVDLIKDKIPDVGRFSYYLPLLSVGMGMVLAFSIEPVKLFSLLGFTGVNWWTDKIFAGLVIGLGASFIYDLTDRD